VPRELEVFAVEDEIVTEGDEADVEAEEAEIVFPVEGMGEAFTEEAFDVFDGAGDARALGGGRRRGILAFLYSQAQEQKRDQIEAGGADADGGGVVVAVFQEISVEDQNAERGEDAEKAGEGAHDLWRDDVGPEVVVNGLWKNVAEFVAGVGDGEERDREAGEGDAVEKVGRDGFDP